MKTSIIIDYQIVIVDLLGEMAEWLKAPVSKTGICIPHIAGSNPALSAKHNLAYVITH